VDTNIDNNHLPAQNGRDDRESSVVAILDRVVGATRRAAGRVARSRSGRIAGALLLIVGLFLLTQRSFVAEQMASYATDSQSPPLPAEWMVDDAILQSAAEASRGTHGPDGEIHHTVDYPHQLLAALESPTYSVEGNVTVVDGTAVLQHDPRVPIGMPLLQFLEYAAIAELPIVKLDLKRDDSGPIIADVHQAVDEFGLKPSQMHFNANVFRGPGVENDIFGARSDKSFVDRMYNLIVMELETSDLVRFAEEFPDSTIVISSTTATGPMDIGYSEKHLDQFVEAAEEIRETNPQQPLAFAVRGDLAAQSGPGFIEGLSAVDNSYVAAWWSGDVPSEPEEIQTLRNQGVTFFDTGQEKGL
ncbi:MAG: DUF2181 domain-containing protein, partial [Acidimicrobiales bacterium]|nr:DUF2181 domain-containing protein [Acidimicrobiales bacterium]